MRAAPARPRHRPAWRRRARGSVLSKRRGVDLQSAAARAGRRRFRVSQRRARLRRPPAARSAAGVVSTAACIPALRLAAVIAATRTSDVSLRVINVNASSLTLDGRHRAARRQEQCCCCAIAAASARFRTSRRPTCSAAGRRAERLQGQDRLRRHDRPRHARGGGDADRHAVRRRRSAGDGGRQPAAARLHPPARTRRTWSRRRSSSPSASSRRCWLAASASSGAASASRGVPRGCVGRVRSCCCRAPRHVPVAAVSDARPDGVARDDGGGADHARAEPRRRGGPRQGDVAAI